MGRFAALGTFPRGRSHTLQSNAGTPGPNRTAQAPSDLQGAAQAPQKALPWGEPNRSRKARRRAAFRPQRRKKPPHIHRGCKGAIWPGPVTGAECKAGRPTSLAGDIWAQAPMPIPDRQERDEGGIVAQAASGLFLRQSSAEPLARAAQNWPSGSAAGTQHTPPRNRLGQCPGKPGSSPWTNRHEGRVSQRLQRTGGKRPTSPSLPQAATCNPQTSDQRATGRNEGRNPHS